jgi:hypothetical protein
MAAAGSSPHEGQLDVLARGMGTDLRKLQIKLTYVGSQTKPVPTVAFTTFYHIIRMDWFLSHRRSGLHYNNDEIAVWNFTVTPDEIRRIVAMLSRLEAVQEHRGTEEACLSLMIVLQDSRLGPSAFEAVLDLDSVEAVIDAIRDALDEGNGLGRQVMDLQRQLILS